jgi:hypothetical protein
MVATLFTRLGAKPVMLVLGLPRTGTKTMLHFLHANYADRYEVCHSHGLSDHWLQELARWSQAPKGDGQPRGPAWVQEKIVSRARTLKLLSHAPFTLVVVTVRDPVARAYSAIVYRHEAFLRRQLDQGENRFRDLPAIRALMDRCGDEELSAQGTWFDYELKRQFGIDVRKHCPDGGPLLMETKGLTFLVAKCEEMDQMIAEIRHKVPQGERIVYQRKNSSAQRETKPMLDALIAQAPLAPRIVKKMYELPEVRHLYGTRQIDAFLAHWQRAAA